MPRLAAVVLASGVVGSIGAQFTLTNTLMAARVFELAATLFASLAMAVTVGCLLGSLCSTAADWSGTPARGVRRPVRATGGTGGRGGGDDGRLRGDRGALPHSDARGVMQQPVTAATVAGSYR
ncbi:hypothetical protein [Streptomyces sp. NPDC127084]|uniref:hypothetical protein n=1 Tax=Streptomyces sp. NPDC127084 TaxID=3347133 RepID=UPI0036509DB7